MLNSATDRKQISYIVGGGVAPMGDWSFIEGAIDREGVLLAPGITP